jgi:predicted 2-oxoglutarate/Fe(II)-dependent dioxygenase YbiX
MAECAALDTQRGAINNDDGQSSFVDSVRNNQVVFLQTNHWLEGILVNHCRYANTQAGWNYTVNQTEAVQISTYTAGQKYDWHTDSSVLQRDPRKLTAVVQLSKSSSFEGGGLYLDGFEGSVLLEQGDMVVFPSYLRHTAKEVTSGVRQTATIWMRGPSFT